MQYDLPTESATSIPIQRFEAPESKNMAALQGAEQGAAMTSMGDTMAKAGHMIQAEIDDANTKAADNALTDGITSLMTDPENGYLAKNGKGALDATPNTVEALQKLKQDSSANLRNDVQRFQYERLSNHRINAAMLQVNGHAIQQAKAWNIGETDARVNANLKAAVANSPTWNMPTTEDYLSPYATAKQTMVQSAVDLANLHGFPEGSEESKQMVQKATTNLHTEVIANMITSGNSSGARDYYKANVQEIDPTRRDNITKMIEPAEEASIAADVYIPGKTSMMDAFSTIDSRFPNDATKREGIKRSVLSMDANYQRAVGSTVSKASNDIFKVINDAKDNGGQVPSWGQISSMPGLQESVQTIASNDPTGYSKLKDSIDKVQTDSDVQSLLQSLDTKLFDLHSKGQYPSGKSAVQILPELGALQQIDPTTADKVLGHIQQAYQGNVHWNQSIYTMVAQQKAAEQQGKQQQQFMGLLGNKTSLMAVNPVALKAIGALSPEQASMITELQKKETELAKGHPVSWSQEQLKTTVKGLLGFKGVLDANKEQTVEVAAADLGMYIFRLEKTGGGALNPAQVENAARDWIKRPAFVVPMFGNANKVTTGEMYGKKEDDRLGPADVYTGVYNSFKQRGITPNLDQMRQAMRFATGGAL